MLKRLMQQMRDSQPQLYKGEYRVHYSDRNAILHCSQILGQFLRNARQLYNDYVILCIGTDRSTGDSLGPLVGTNLKMKMEHSRVHVYGTLDNPVHATNLSSTMEEIGIRYRRPYVIAIDACLGRLENVGSIALGEGTLRPGAGVNKELPEVGNLYLTGVVNVGGFMEYVVLQNTRLSIVMRLSNCITDIITSAVDML